MDTRNPSIKIKLEEFRGSSLLMNSVYLMLATNVLALFGFVFWVIVTRTYSAATVGLTATLLSLSGLLSMLSLAGFDTTFVRFLPTSKHQNDQINSGLVIVGLASALLSFGFVLSFPLTSPGLVFVRDNPWYLLAFVFFTVVTSLNTLTNAILLAFKSARDIFIINMLFSALKVALPLLIVNDHVMAIFVLVGLSQLAGLVISLAIIGARPQYSFSPKIHLDFLRMIRRYSFSVYLSSVLNLLPPTLLPLLVVHQLGPENAAYYYIAFTIASALYTIAYASMQSAFAESSHDEAALRLHIIKAAKLIVALMIPAIVLTLVLSSFVLRIFGGEYAIKGGALLRLFSLSALSVAVYSGMGAIFKVTKHLHAVVIMNGVYATVILGTSYVLVPHVGLIAIGWAWLLGNVVAGGVGFVFLKQANITSR